jgi:hypothetical protein
MRRDETYMVEKRYALIFWIRVPISFAKSVHAFTWIETDQTMSRYGYVEE